MKELAPGINIRRSVEFPSFSLNAVLNQVAIVVVGNVRHNIDYASMLSIYGAEVGTLAYKSDAFKRDAKLANAVNTWLQQSGKEQLVLLTERNIGYYEDEKGAVLVRQLKALNPAIRCLVLGSIRCDDVRQLQEEGLAEYLQKPFPAPTLAMVVLALNYCGRHSSVNNHRAHPLSSLVPHPISSFSMKELIEGTPSGARNKQ